MLLYDTEEPSWLFDETLRLHEFASYHLALASYAFDQAPYDFCKLQEHKCLYLVRICLGMFFVWPAVNGRCKTVAKKACGSNGGHKRSLIFYVPKIQFSKNNFLELSTITQKGLTGAVCVTY